jgi:hypothetical protein
MRLQIAADLHLEFPENQDIIALNPLQIAGDILILAGDIVPLQADMLEIQKKLTYNMQTRVL